MNGALPGKPTIQVLYTCDGCKLQDRKVTVLARKPGEDIQGWMDKVTRAISDDHTQRSPFCRSRTVKDIKIPLNKGADSYIGQPVDATETR